ncbi:MAG: MFS transporter [Spirochaeta sp.]
MKHRTTQITLIAAHFLFALLVTSMQPLLPVFQEEFGLGLFQSSILPIAVTVSVMIANLFVGFLIGHLGQKTVLVGSAILETAAILLIFLSPGFIGVFIGFSCIGLASGSAFTALITIYSELPDAYQDFGLFHAFFGVGGMASPIIANLWLSSGRGIGGLFGIYGLAFFLLLACLILSRQIHNLRFREFAMKDMVKSLSSPIIILGVLILSFYAAVEIGGTTWHVNAGMSIFGLDKSSAGFLLSGFWLTFTLSRIVTDAIARRTGELQLALMCSAAAAVILVLWLAGSSPYLFPFLGFALGPILPVVQKHVNGRLPRHQRGLFNGVTYLGTGIGATVFIPFMGALGEFNLALAYIPLVVNLVIMIGLLHMLRTR